MVSPIELQIVGLAFAIFGGMFSIFLFALLRNDFGYIVGGVCAFIAIIGIILIAYSLPMIIEDKVMAEKKEKDKELELKNSDCKTIQKYLLDTADSDNNTTKYGTKIYHLKCKGIGN